MNEMQRKRKGEQNREADRPKNKESERKREKIYIGRGGERQREK